MSTKPNKRPLTVSPLSYIEGIAVGVLVGVLVVVITIAFWAVPVLGFLMIQGSIQFNF